MNHHKEVNISVGKVEGGESKPSKSYSPTTTPLMWSSDLYVNELMKVKKRPQSLEARGLYEDTKMKEFMDANWQLSRENKFLKEEISRLHISMSKEEQELFSIRQTLAQSGAIDKSISKEIEESNNSQTKEIQSVLDSMKIKEN